MSMLMNITRNCWRGSLIQACYKSKMLGCNSNPFILKTNTKFALKYGSPLSTSQIVLKDHSEHSHSQIWTAERFLSGGLLGLLPLSIAFPNPALDYALALALTAHVHWGVEAIVVDYVRPNVVGDAISRASVAAVYALSVFTVGGLFYFNYSDVGIGQAIRMLWKL